MTGPAFPDPQAATDPSQRFGYPGSVPDPGVLDAFRRYLAANVNLYGMHIREGTAEPLSATARERAAVTGAARLSGLPSETLGYLCTGASEAALFAVWAARESGIHSALASERCHSATRKALTLGGLWPGTTLARAPLDEPRVEEALAGIPDDEPLLATLTWIHPIHVETDALEEVVPRLRQRKGPTLIFVDGAVGGILGPTVRGETLEALSVDVLGLDFHKVGQAPVGTGAVLYRPELHEQVRTPEPYLPYGEDTTVTGSRNGAFAAAAAASLDLAADGTLAARYQALHPRAGTIRERLGTRLVTELFPYFLLDIGPWPPGAGVMAELAAFDVHPVEREGRALVRICLAPGQDGAAFASLVELLASL